jgi:flotillin
MTLEIDTGRVYTSKGVPISVVGTAQVKINGSNEEMLAFAAEMFGDKTTDEVLTVCLQTMEGHQRAIMGSMTVEEIYRDRQTFSSKVFDQASSDLYNMGVMVVSYTIKDVSDEVGYLASLGQARTAQVKRDAIIGISPSIPLPPSLPFSLPLSSLLSPSLALLSFPPTRRG